MSSGNNPGAQTLNYHISGSVAKKRILPLLHNRVGVENTVELDVEKFSTQAPPSFSGAVGHSTPRVAFCWENTPARATKLVREESVVFSHVANAHLLEDKWALGLIQDRVPTEDECPILVTHCLRGRSAVVKWCSERWSGTASRALDEDLWMLKDAESNGAGGIWVLSHRRWRDVCGDIDRVSSKDESHELIPSPLSISADANSYKHPPQAVPPARPSPSTSPSPLHEGHRYVAQQYVASPFTPSWGAATRSKPTSSAEAAGAIQAAEQAAEAAPASAGSPRSDSRMPTRGPGLRLWKGRKFHVRAYAVLTADLGVYLNRKAFLHVANKPFLVPGGGAGPAVASEADDEVHITNCCANSSNRDAFAGEIVIEDLSDPSPFPGIETTGAPPVGVAASATAAEAGRQAPPASFAQAFLDMQRVLSALVSGAAPFMEAQRSPHDLEYMGVDFMVDAAGRAWLLEFNCPPSQDTATGLPHAEALHDAVLGDLLDVFVLPPIRRRQAQGVTPRTHEAATAAAFSSSSSPASSSPVCASTSVPLPNSDGEADQTLGNGGGHASTVSRATTPPHQDAGAEAATAEWDGRRSLHGTGWVECRAPSLVPFKAAAKTTGNALRWKMFETKALRRRASPLPPDLAP